MLRHNDITVAMTKHLVLLLAALAALLSSSCTNAFKDSIRNEIEEDVTFVMAQANVESNVGATFGWGAIIANVVHTDTGTYMEVLHTPLNNRHRIIDKKISYGRYIAFSASRLDPEDYYPGRLLSIAGILIKESPATLDGGPYSYPVVEALSIKVWGKAKSIPVPQFPLNPGKPMPW